MKQIGTFVMPFERAAQRLSFLVSPHDVNMILIKLQMGHSDVLIIRIQQARVADHAHE